MRFSQAWMILCGAVAAWLLLTHDGGRDRNT
jgi:hypothetical protein